MNKVQRLIGIFAVFGIIAAVAYWLYLYFTEGSAPSVSDIFVAAKGGAIAVTGIGKYSFNDLVTLAQTAGFSADDSRVAAAVALAESSGNPASVGDLDVTPGGSIGLWQINLAAHPEFDASQLTDPATNASAAFDVFQKAGGFTPWSTYNSGAYLNYMPADTAPVIPEGQ